MSIWLEWFQWFLISFAFCLPMKLGKKSLRTISFSFVSLLFVMSEKTRNTPVRISSQQKQGLFETKNSSFIYCCYTSSILPIFFYKSRQCLDFPFWVYLMKMISCIARQNFYFHYHIKIFFAFWKCMWGEALESIFLHFVDFFWLWEACSVSMKCASLAVAKWCALVPYP